MITKGGSAGSDPSSVVGVPDFGGQARFGEGRNEKVEEWRKGWYGAG